MSRPTVYYYNNTGDVKWGVNSFFEKISRDFGGERAALKIHFGEGENDTHVKAGWLSDAPKYFKNPVFVECNVLYKGGRTTREKHEAVAEKNDFDFLPIDILDGECGEDQLEVEAGGRVAKLGSGLKKYDKLVAVSHFTGHMGTGFGGALKNVGMGLGSREGKMSMHSIIAPVWRKSKCRFCGLCAENCAFDAIEVGEEVVIHEDRCVGCARCIAVCPTGAIDVPWDLSQSVNKKLMENIADYALAAVQGRRWWFMNFLTDITFNCDCLPGKQKPFMKDVGILLSSDPVAADQASLDLIVENNDGVDPFKEKHDVDGSHILEHAEKIGLGAREYELNTVE